VDAPHLYRKIHAHAHEFMQRLSPLKVGDMGVVIGTEHARISPTLAWQGHAGRFQRSCRLRSATIIVRRHRRTGVGPPEERSPQMTIDWLDDADTAKAEALRLRRPILIDVYKVP
jgi:hypothetical protein